MQGVSLKRHAVVLAISVLGLAFAPAASHAAVTKIPVTLTFTGVESDGSIRGQVASTKAKCVRGVDVHGQNDLAHLSTSSDEQGNFTYTDDFLADLGFEDFDAYVRVGPKFGKQGRKKRCGGAKGTVDFTYGTTDIDTIEFNDATNTFSGTLSSGIASCSNSAPLELSHRGIESDQYVFDRSLTSGSGSFSVEYGSEPEPGLWGVFPTSFISESTLGSNASVTLCDPGFGKAVEIVE